MNREKRYDGAASATLAGIADLFRRSEPAGTLTDDDRIDGRTCLVTGATSGLGFAAACELALRGGRLIVTGRSAGPDLERRIREAVARRDGDSPVQVSAETIDLLDFGSVEAFVERLSMRNERLDIAVFNAGAVASRSRLSADGYEEMLQTNYLAKYLLVRRLLERGCIRPDPQRPPRLIFVSSEAHRSSPDVDVSTFASVPQYSMRGSMRYYAYSKLLLTAFTEELSRRLNDGQSPDDDGRSRATDGGGKRPGPDEAVRAKVLTLCPGPVNSSIAREAPAIFQPVLRVFFSLFFRSPRRAAEPIVYFACAPDAGVADGAYLHLMNRKEKDPRARDEEFGRHLWAESERLTLGRP